METFPCESMRNVLVLDDVLSKAAENHHWAPEQATAALEWYLAHWLLAAKHPRVPLAALSKAADELWHQHILDTRKYFVDCTRVLGTYMHHQPVYGEPNAVERAAYDATVKLYEEEFGRVPSDLAITSGAYSYRPAV